MRTALIAALCVSLCMGCGQSQAPESQARRSETTGESPAKEAGTDESTDAMVATGDVIIPGQGVGALRFGMSQSEMEAVLGKPDRSMGTAYEYLSQGMAVLGSKESAVGAILFGDMNNANSPLVKACRFKTDKGIGMGSTFDALVGAYGQPSAVTPMGKAKSVSYKPLGATFTLMKDKVIHMQFRHP